MGWGSLIKGKIAFLIWAQWKWGTDMTGLKLPSICVAIISDNAAFLFWRQQT